MTKAEEMIREYTEKYSTDEECDYYNPIRPIWLDKEADYLGLVLVVGILLLGVFCGRFRRK